MASSTEIETVHVRLLDEAVDVWRPVRARRLSEAAFELSRDTRPEDEAWSFEPGDAVVVERRRLSGPEIVLAAVARAADLDQRSATPLRKAG